MPNKKILLVDDDPDIIVALSAILKPHDFEIITANNASEAFEKLTNKKPDLAILDVIMDNQHDGFDLARKIKKTEGFEKLPIIMLTSISEVTGVNFSAAASDPDWLPVEEFIDKPVEPKILLEIIDDLLN
jgi:CheY-like chemotaxis protein